MACIVATLEASDGSGLFSQQVDDLAFTFVAPLRTNHYYAFAHGYLPNDEKHYDANRGDRQPRQSQTVVIHLRDANNCLP